MAHSWQYGDWRSQTTQRAKRDRLALHLEEIEERKDAISASGGQMSAAYEGLEAKLARLEPMFDELDKQVRDASAGGPVMVARFRRRSPK